MDETTGTGDPQTTTGPASTDGAAGAGGAATSEATGRPAPRFFAEEADPAGATVGPQGTTAAGAAAVEASPFDEALKLFEAPAVSGGTTTSPPAADRTEDVEAIVRRMLAEHVPSPPATTRAASEVAGDTDGADVEPGSDKDPVLDVITRRVVPNLESLERRLTAFETAEAKRVQTEARARDEQALQSFVTNLGGKMTMVPEATRRTIVQSVAREALRAYRAGEIANPADAQRVVGEAFRERVSARKEAAGEAAQRLATVRDEAKAHTVTTTTGTAAAAPPASIRQMAKERFGTDRLTLEQWHRLEADGGNA